MASNILGSAIGIPLALGTQIPNLVRGGRESAKLKDIQKHGGAGALAARRSADEGARAAAGIAGGGNSASRGLNLLTGLRAGERIRDAGAAQASQVAAPEGLVGTQALRQDDVARRAGIGQVGAATTGALAQFSAQSLAAGDATAKQAAEAAGAAHENDLAAMQAGTMAEPTVAPPGQSNQEQMDAAVDAMSPGEQEAFLNPQPGVNADSLGYGSDDGPQAATAPKAGMPGAGLNQLDAAVARGVVPESGKTIDEAIAIGVNEIGAFATDPDFAAGVAGAAVQWVNEVGGIALD